MVNFSCEQVSLYQISLFVNFSFELGKIITRYDFLEAKWMILNNDKTFSNLNKVRTPSNFIYYHLCLTCYIKWAFELTSSKSNHTFWLILAWRKSPDQFPAEDVDTLPKSEFHFCRSNFSPKALFYILTWSLPVIMLMPCQYLYLIESL